MACRILFYDNTRLLGFLNARRGLPADFPNTHSLVFCSHPDDDGIGLVLLENGGHEAPDLAEAFWTQPEAWVG